MSHYYCRTGNPISHSSTAQGPCSSLPHSAAFVPPLVPSSFSKRSSFLFIFILFLLPSPLPRLSWSVDTHTMLTPHEQSGSTYFPSNLAVGQSPHPMTPPAILLREAYARSSAATSYAVPSTLTLSPVTPLHQVSQLANVPGAGASIPAGGTAGPVPASKSSVSSLSKWGPRRGAPRNSVIRHEAVSAHFRDSTKVSCRASVYWSHGSPYCRHEPVADMRR